MTTLPSVRLADQLPDQGTTPVADLDTTSIAGTWYATDPHADGVSRLVVGVRDGTPTVHAFAAGPDEPYDWGEVPATVYGAGVTATEAMAITAYYRFDFLAALLAAYSKQGILVLDTFTMFTDGSGRANYFSREFFHR